jgi:hypothetical protein
MMRKRRSFVDYLKKIVQPFVSLLRLSSRVSRPPFMLPLPSPIPPPIF